MLRALLESGVKPDVVVGSSVGAINGAYFAGEPTLQGVSRLERLWCGLKRSDIFPWTWRRLFSFIRGRGHLVTSDGLKDLLDRNLPYRDMRDAALPLHIVASDALTGNAVVLSRGPVTQAILASTAIPAAFEPVEIDGRLLCDGAIASNTPVTSAIALLTASQLVAELERIREPTQYHILPTACPLGVTPFDFARTPELIDQAYRRTLNWIAEGGLDSNTIPAALRPHSHTGTGALRPPPIEWVDRDHLQRRRTVGREAFTALQ
jgi:NTE family protein